MPFSPRTQYRTRNNGNMTSRPPEPSNSLQLPATVISRLSIATVAHHHPTPHDTVFCHTIMDLTSSFTLSFAISLYLAVPDNIYRPVGLFGRTYFAVPDELRETVSLTVIAASVFSSSRNCRDQRSRIKTRKICPINVREVANIIQEQKKEA